MKKLLIFTIFCAVALIFSCVGLAQEGQEVIEESDSSYGIVVAVDKAANKITLSEYDWESDSEVEVIYTVDPEIKVENAASWHEIPIGSEVDIEYVVGENEKLIAKGISVYTPETLEEE